MSHSIPAIVESVVDLKSIERQVQKAKVALDDADRMVEATGKKHESAVEAQRRARVDLGRQLAEARDACPHGEWLPFLKRCGIVQQSASNWIRQAGYEDEHPKLPTRNDVGNSPAPTLRDAGIDKRPRKAEREREEQPDPVADWTSEIQRRRDEQPPAIDISRELSRIQDKLCEAAQTASRGVRQQIAAELRETARLIEEMP